MKAILISIKPKYVADILNGNKTIEIRKTMPKCDLPIDVYIYCTKDNHQLVKPKDYDKYLLFTKGAVNYSNEQTLNGKVVAKFTLNKVEEILIAKTLGVPVRFTRALPEKDLCIATCLTPYDFNDYLKNKLGYAWHISNLVIFDRPRELSEFRQCKEKKCPYSLPCHRTCHSLQTLTKAPQSYCFVESEN